MLKTIKHLSILTFILFYLNFPSFSQNGELKFRHLALKDGLSSDVATSIVQDQKGFLWIGTENGLSRYDGNTFKVYKYDPIDTTAISHNYILSLFLDTTGIIWIGTNGGGMSRYDPVADQFRQFRNDPNIPHSIHSNFVNSIIRDSRGILWLGTRNAGLIRMNEKENTFSRFLPDTSLCPFVNSNSINVIYEDRKGELWIGTDGSGLYHLYFKDNEPMHVLCDHYLYEPSNPNGLSNNVIYSVVEDRYSEIWIATFGGGLNKLNRDSEIFTRYLNDKNDKNSLTGNYIRTLFIDASDKLWVGTDAGLNIYNPGNDNFFQIRHSPLKPGGLNVNNIYSVCEDRSGIFFIGTNAGGLNIYNPRADDFGHFNHDPENPKSLGGNIIGNFCEDAEGYIWIATRGQGIDRFDPRTKEFTHYRHDPVNPNSLSSDFIRVVQLDHNGMIWIGTNGSGLNKFDPSEKKFTRFLHNTVDSGSLSHDRVYEIYEDSKRMLWIGTVGGGLNRFIPETGKFDHYFHHDEDTNSIISNDIYLVFEDKTGTLWIGTYAGLSKFNASNGSFKNYSHNPVNSETISNDHVTSISEDRNGIFWVGTWGGGLNMMNRDNGTFKRFNEKNGLPDDVVSGIWEDQHETLWLSGLKGIFRFNPVTGKVKQFEDFDGLQGNGFNGKSIYKTRDGHMLFGGLDGFNFFHPDSIRENTHIPSIAIVSFKLFNKEMKFDTNITELKEIVLEYSQNEFSFEFAALDFANSAKNQYAYMMEGFNDQWIQTQNRTATYTNLDPGSYTFRVKGSNSDGIWNEDGVAVRITIIPPFWRTGWFYALCVLFFGGAVFMLIKSRERNMKRRQLYLEEQVRMRTAELSEKNAEIITQNVSITKKNKDITDSISYARRIQQAILPPIYKLQELMPESFILFKPRDIVSGDFYWFAETDGNIFLASVDCTGHGVPGAFLSLIGNNLLNDIVCNNKINEPSLILQNLHEGMVKAFSYDIREIYTSAGMDMVICSLDLKNKIISFCSGSRPLVLIRNLKAQIYKGGKLPVGLEVKNRKRAFETVTLKLHDNDTIYIYSDGYCDQFGGASNSKFYEKRFIELLVSINAKSMQQQKEMLDETIEKWKGEIKQIDDICVIGIRV